MSGPKGDQTPAGMSSTVKSAYWNTRFFLTNIILAFLALVSAYLEYVYYPSLLLSAPFGERNLSLHLSLFTYSFDATRGSEFVPGIPALDFFQIFVIAILLINLSHYLEWRRK